MQKSKSSPYLNCPVYETRQFRLRLVQQEDAEDLLTCYSDPASAKIFNSDNCTSNFIYHSMAEMQSCIRFWLDDYARHAYVRWSIIDQKSNRAVGTIEFFARPETFAAFGKVGILRLDLASPFEQESAITEILEMIEHHFNGEFEVDSILTKAIPTAEQRIRALNQIGYQELEHNPIMPYSDYYIRVKNEP